MVQPSNDLGLMEAFLFFYFYFCRVMQGLHELANSYYGHVTKENNKTITMITVNELVFYSSLKGGDS